MSAVRAIDLNLLRVFAAVLDKRSIAGAAEQLFLSPSAVSHALARLRSRLDDRLFVATGDGMQPTTYASVLAPQIGAALAQFDLALRRPVATPAPQRFSIAADEHLGGALLQQLVARLSRRAPQTQLSIVAAQPEQALRQLDSGKVDAVLHRFDAVPSQLHRRRAWTDCETLAVRSGHPLTRGVLTAERLDAYPRMIVRPAWPVADGGPEREPATVDVVLPGHANVIAILECSDLVAALPRSVALAAAEQGRVVMLAPPYVSRIVALDLVWSGGATAVPALIGEALAVLDEISPHPHCRLCTRHDCSAVPFNGATASP